jgi:type IV secretion system protein VirD4
MNVQPKTPARRQSPPKPRFQLPQITLPERLSSGFTLFLLAYGGYLLGTGAGAVSHFGKLFARMVPPLAIASFPLDLWGFAAGLLFAVVALNPFAWLNGKRLVVGTTAVAMMLGCVAMNVSSGLILELVSLFQPNGFGMIPATSPAYFVGIIAALLLMPVVMIFSGSFVILTLFGIVSGFFTFFVGVPVMLFKQILEFDHALHIYRYQARGLAGYIVRFVFWLRNETQPNVPDDSKGARFAAPEEIARLQNPRGMGFGHVDGQLLQLHTEKHVLIMASTRSGKGVTLIIPHLLRYRGSAFVLDPKGENAKATGRQRAALNQKVYYLDPFGISGKKPARFNPLSRFTPENMESESKALAAALFVTKDDKRDHWTESGQQLLAALILFVYVSPQIPPNKKDLPTVRRRLLGELKETLEAMLHMDDADGLLHDLAFSFLETPAKEFGSIVSTAQRQTDILDNPAMIACLSASGAGQEVDFKEWRRGTMTVYLCLSAPKFPVFNRWLRLVVTSALDEMTDTLDPPPLPVCFMLDELATLGHVQPVENAIGLAAGYGVQLLCVFQDVAQMRDLYKGRWASFIGNAGVRALFNLDDYDTAKYWSDFIGGRIVATHSTQQDNYGLSRGQNVGETMRPLLSPDEIMLRFGAGKMLVLPQGERPIVADRFAYWQDPALNGLWDDPRQGGTRDVAGDAKASAKLGGLNAPPPAPPQAPTGGGAPRPNPPPPIRPAPAAPAAKPTETAAAPFAPTGNAGAPVEVEVFDEGGVNCILYSDASVGAITATGITRYESLGAFRRAQASAPAADTRQEPEEEPREVNRHVAGDITYVMFSDGAVEVRNADGAQRFASLQALRKAAAAAGM